MLYCWKAFQFPLIKTKLTEAVVFIANCSKQCEMFENREKSTEILTTRQIDVYIVGTFVTNWLCAHQTVGCEGIVCSKEKYCMIRFWAMNIRFPQFCVWMWIEVRIYMDGVSWLCAVISIHNIYPCMQWRAPRGEKRPYKFCFSFFIFLIHLSCACYCCCWWFASLP